MADDNVIEFSIKAKDEFSSIFNKFSSTFAVKVAASVAAAGAAMFAFGKAVAESQVHVGTLAHQAGISAEAMSGLAHAAELSQSSIDEVSNGLKFMQKTMGEANQGNIQAQRTFRDLGFTTRDASGKTKDANVALSEMADKFNAIQDPAERTRLALQVFGRGGQDMIKVMAEGSEGLKRMAEDARFLGVVLSEQTVANAKAFDDQTNRLTQSIKGVSNAIAGEWIPILTGLTRALANQIAEWREPLREFAASALNAILTAYVAVKQFVSGVYDYTVKSFSSAEGFDNFIENAKRAFMLLLNVAGLAMKSLAPLMFESFRLIWQSFFELGKWAWQKVFDFVTGQNLADTLGEVLFKRIPEATQETVDRIKGIFGELRPEWAQLAEEGGQLFSDVFGMSAESIKKEVDALKQKFTEYGEVRKQVETETTNVSIEQAYKNFLAQQTLLEESANAHIFYAQTLQETLTATWDLIGIKALNTSQQVSQLIMQTYDQVTSGIGASVAKAIVLGENLAMALKRLAQDVLISVLAMLVKMGVQRLILMALNVTSSATEASSNLARGFAETYVNSFASAAAIPFYGWAIAPGAAATNLALAVSGAAGAMATGGAMGAMAGVAHGGLTSVPREGTFLLDEGERVLSPAQNRDLTGFLNSQSDGMNIQTPSIHIHIEGDINRMSDSDLKELIADRIYRAMNSLNKSGVRPDFVQRLAR